MNPAEAKDLPLRDRTAVGGREDARHPRVQLFLAPSQYCRRPNRCTFCRIGTRHLLTILDRITKGEGREQDLELLQTLSQDIKDGSLCGLGKTAPNPVLTSLRYFRDEYEAHVREKGCPALMCRPLTAFYIPGQMRSRLRCLRRFLPGECHLYQAGPGDGH